MADEPGGSSQAGTRQAAGSVPLSAELVQQVTERVYQLLLRDLRQTRERQGQVGWTRRRLDEER